MANPDESLTIRKSAGAPAPLVGAGWGGSRRPFRVGVLGDSRMPSARKGGGKAFAPEPARDYRELFNREPREP